LLSLLTLLTLATDEYADYTYEQYIAEYKKSYLSEAENNFRRTLFESRLKEIKEHNSNPTFTWQLGVNQFTDMTEEEQKSFRGLNKKLLYQTNFQKKK
jgi:hypothetical protein